MNARFVRHIELNTQVDDQLSGLALDAALARL